MTNPDPDLHNRLLDILNEYWGYTSFRELQEEIMTSVMRGNDTLGLMPTGGGKSITFQVPGLALGGLTLVITPLISLMKDQVDNLKKRNIRAVFFHSAMTYQETRVAWEHLVNGRARFLYVAPERLRNERFLFELRHLNVTLIVVDEAHCISQWGYDFRPSYLLIGDLRKHLPGVPLLALTATATPRVAQDIAVQLKFKQGMGYRMSFARPNISYIVRKAESKFNEVFNILSKTKGSAIVYVRSRKKTGEIAEFLNQAGIVATSYHAGLEYEEKERRQNEWKADRVRVMVATNAFGMGIDKPDVRVVIHLDFPPSLEEYYQEAGRAGRDGLPSYAVLISSKHDRGVLRRRVTETFPPREDIRYVYERICVHYGLEVGEGYEMLREFDLEKFCKAHSLQERFVRSSLNLLGQAGYLDFIEEAENGSRVHFLVERDELYGIHDITPTDETVMKTMLRTYPGMFSDFINISESKIAAEARLTYKEVTQSLIDLGRKKILSYIPRNRVPFIHFPTAREEARYVQIGKDIYEERREVMEQRVEAMIDYGYNDADCRVGRMLKYFGEPEARRCGTCDVCRDSRTPKDSVQSAADRILTALRANPQGLSPTDLVRLMGPYTGESFPVVSFLRDEGQLEFRNGLYFALT